MGISDDRQNVYELKTLHVKNTHTLYLLYQLCLISPLSQLKNIACMHWFGEVGIGIDSHIALGLDSLHPDLR